jgi:hypothetical protein
MLTNLAHTHPVIEQQSIHVRLLLKSVSVTF